MQLHHFTFCAGWIVVEGVLFCGNYFTESPRAAQTSSCQLSLSNTTTDLSATSAVALYDITISNDKFLRGWPCNMAMTAASIDAIINLAMDPFFIPKGNSNDKSLRSVLWTSDDLETSDEPLICCWGLGVRGFILWGIRDCNVKASSESAIVDSSKPVY